MKLSWAGAALLSAFLSVPSLLSGQVSSPQSAAAASQELYPDQGYLSSTRYVNRYFGFAFDFPLEAQLEPVPQPVARDDRIQILHLGGPPSAYAAVSIFAFPVRAKIAPDAKTVLRKALDQELMLGVEELHGLSRITLAGHLFHFYETRRGVEQRMALATNLEAYVVVVVLAANNEKTVKELEASFQRVIFLVPGKLREYAGSGAEEYEGPAISAHRLGQLQADPPVSHIDAGRIAGNVYENQTLGFQYSIRPGWTWEAQGAVEPAIARSRQWDFEQPWIGTGERELMKVCNRTLFSAWAKRPAADGQLSYDDFGEVTVSAVSTSCFPGMRFPSGTADRRAIEDFLLQLRLTHPILRDMRDAKAFRSGGNLVVFLHGAVGFQVPNDALSRRLSIAMAITSRRGYLLTWFFAAPHDSELSELLDDKVSFDAEPLTKEASAAKPGGGDVPSENLHSVPMPAGPPASETPAQAMPTGAQPVNHQATPSTASSSGTGEQPNVAAAPASPAPSLLRPGETMQDQQVKGQPLPQKH